MFPTAMWGITAANASGTERIRRVIDWTRKCIADGMKRSYSERCRRCGGVTFDGAVREVRRELGLDG